MCHWCEPDENGYVEWWGSGGAFLYEANPAKWDERWLGVKAWMRGLPLDLDIPYV